MTIQVVFVSFLRLEGINAVLGNDYLASRGLTLLKDIWINIYYGR